METQPETPAATTPKDPILAWAEATNQFRSQLATDYLRAVITKPESFEPYRKQARALWEKEMNDTRRIIRDGDDDIRGEELEAKARPKWSPLVRAGEMLADEARQIASGIVQELMPLPDMPAPVVASPDPVDQPSEAVVT